MIYTVGHSTLALDGLVALLRDAGLRGIADVRRHPGSRRLPWCAAEALAESLPADGIAYTHLPELGGRASDHELTPFAVVADGRLTYPPQQLSLG